MVAFGSVPSPSSDLGGSSSGSFGFSGGSVGQPQQDTSAGKFNLDLTDPSSLMDIAGSAAKFVGGIGGGALGLIGSVGVPGGPTLGDVPGAIGQGLGAVGSVQLPYLGGPGGHAATIGDIPGEIGNILSAPERAVERTIAGQRVEHAKTGQGVFNEALPPDLQAKLDAGASVNDIADELVARNAGFTNNPILNIGAGILFDPLNLILPGVGKVGALAGKYGTALRTTEEASKLNLGERFVGSAYNAAMRGLPTATGAAMDKALGGTTSAIFHSLGSGGYSTLRSGLGKISEDAAGRLDDALGKFAGNMNLAAVANTLGDEVQNGARLAANATVEDTQRALTAMKSVNPGTLARRVENLLDRVKPLFVGMDQAARREWAVPRLAEIAGISTEDAARALPKRLDDSLMQTLHGAFYGQAGGDLAAAKAALAGDAAAHDIVPRLADLTPISETTLTQERATNLLDAIAKGDPTALDQAAKYDALGKYMGGAPEAVVSRLKDILPKLMGSLPEAIREPITGAHALPPALSAWRAKYAKLGYDLGFGPESGVKVIETKDGAEIFQAPFVHFVDAADPLNVRNPLGRAMDGMFRGITQTKIITTSRNRMIREGAKFGMTESEARGFHTAVKNLAIDRGENIRGLRPSDYQDVLKEVVGDQRFNELRQKVDPTYLVMKSFEGDLGQVGLTQKITGKAKVATSDKGNLVATIAEAIYPKFRFTLSPLFQAQELVESPILNAMRGIRPTKTIDPEVASLYGKLLDLSPEYKTLEGAEYVTRLAGDAAVTRSFGPNTLIGKALSRFDVKGTKEANRIAQIAGENPEAFKSAVQDVNPDLWRVMEQAYNTTDAAAITRAFVGERLALTGGDGANAARMLNAVKPRFSSADEETVWQAFRAAFEESAQKAFTTHYFNPARGALERSLNHPYLGLYPLSYMWGKMVPEFARFLLARPFGLNAPLLGYAAASRVQQGILASIATDPKGFGEWIKDHQGAIYLGNLLLPATPTDFPVNAPAYARHAITGKLGGNGLYRKGDLAGRIGGELGDMISNLGPLRDAKLGLEAGASFIGDAQPPLQDQLDNAAKMLDGMTR